MTDYGHELQFGTFITPRNRDPQLPVRLSTLAEEVGLDLATFQDHPYQPAFLDTWTLLSWVAASTERITVAGNVLNLPLRQPAVLARSAASLDLLSGGRFTMSLGTGAFWDAIEAMGGTRLSPGESVSALHEALRIVRGIWDEGNRTPLRLNGEHYRLSGAKRGPAPAHDVPIWLGAYKPRMLRMVGREADGWSVSLGYMKEGDLARDNTLIDEAAADAGRDPAAIRRALYVTGTLQDSNTGFLQGPTRQWIDELTDMALRDGIGTFIVDGDDPELVQTVGTEIAPAVRDAVTAARRSAGTIPAAARRGPEQLRARREGIDYDSLPNELAPHAVEPGDRQYESLRHNHIRSGSPGIMLHPGGPEDVSQALAWARQQDVPLAVRSAGHGFSGRSTNDGGVILDINRMRDIKVVDEARRRVRIGAGATWGEVAEVLAPRGWAISSGDAGGVGVGGLGTTGGIGYLGRLQGLTIDHVVAAEVVTADGSVVHASAEQNPDLFWALRGAGGNMGVVTWLEVEAGTVGNVVYSQMVLDAGDTAGLLQRWGATVEAAPRGLTSFMILPRARGGQPRTAHLMSMYATEGEDADTDAATVALESLAQAGPVLDHQAHLLPYSAVVASGNRRHAGGGDPASRSGLLTHLDGKASGAIERLVSSGESFYTQIRATGGAVHDLPPEATAYAHRHQNFQLMGMSRSQQEINAVWDTTIAPVQDGSYLSFDTDTRPERLPEAFPQPTLDRLRTIKATYDPENVFRANFPIPPQLPE